MIPAPGSSRGADEEVTRPLHAAAGPAAEPPAEMPSGLPSRAARGPVPGEQSLLDGPSFDGFAVPSRTGREEIRPGQDEETEAFHPGRQSPVPSHPRHAADSGQHPVVAPDASPSGPEGERPASRFQPMAPQPPVEATTVLPTQPGPQDSNAAFKPAPAFGVDVTGPVGGDEATTRFQAPAPDPEETANFGFGGAAPSPAEAAERRAAFARGEAERRAAATPSELDRLAAERAATAPAAPVPSSSAPAAPADSSAGGSAEGGAPNDEPAPDPDATRPLDARPRTDGPSNSPWSQPPRDRS
ncbi:hypothetical protein [Dactylosporangium darangshiense]|uniref:hypothetical protein n=1 Tax=Dactylosporangium darangshiense TaxID=579108 RepID=UPI0031F0F052